MRFKLPFGWRFVLNWGRGPAGTNLLVAVTNNAASRQYGVNVTGRGRWH